MERRDFLKKTVAGALAGAAAGGSLAAQEPAEAEHRNRAGGGDRPPIRDFVIAADDGNVYRIPYGEIEQYRVDDPHDHSHYGCLLELLEKEVAVGLIPDTCGQVYCYVLNIENLK